MRILYLTGGYFPKGSAYASRTLNLSRALLKAGHEILVVADYDEELSAVEHGEIEGIFYTLCDSQKKFSIKQRVNRYCEHVKEALEQKKYDVVISSSDHDRFVKLYSVIKSQNIPLVLESCEWFGYYNWKYGMLNPRYYGFLNCWHRYYPKVDGVIAISRLLENHYLKYTKNVIRIPTLLLETEWNSVPTEGTALRLMYAGSAGKSKDLLKNLILAIAEVREKANVQLHIYGINECVVKKQLGRYASILKDVKESVYIHGKVKQDVINRYYRESDYSVLFRPQRRSSNAGFPTKLAESMMAGTPLICNDTGDVGLYVQNDYNGVVLKDTSPQEICNSLLNLSKKDSSKLRANARNTAIAHFSLDCYTDILNDFFKKIVEG